MKEWECVAVGHHKDVGKVIEDWEKQAGTFTHTLPLKCVQDLRLFTIYSSIKENKMENQFFGIKPEA